MKSRFENLSAGNLWMKVYTTFYRRMLQFAMPLPDRGKDLENQGDFRPDLLDRSEASLYLALRPSQGADEFRRRMELGQRCYVVRHRGNLVHAAWVATGRVRIDYLRSDMILGPDDVYVYDVFTRADFRRKNLTDLRSAFQWPHYRQTRKKRTLVMVAAENYPSLESSRSKGYREIGCYHCLRCGPWQRIWSQPYGRTPLLALAAPDTVNRRR